MKKLILAGLVGIALFAAMVFVSCDPKCDNGNSCSVTFDSNGIRSGESQCYTTTCDVKAAIIGAETFPDKTVKCSCK
jgi:hypothetical protein